MGCQARPGFAVVEVRVQAKGDKSGSRARNQEAATHFDDVSRPLDRQELDIDRGPGEEAVLVGVVAVDGCACVLESGGSGPRLEENNMVQRDTKVAKGEEAEGAGFWRAYVGRGAAGLATEAGCGRRGP